MERNGTGREEDFPYTEYLWVLYGNVYADQASLIIPVGHVHRLDAGAAHGGYIDKDVAVNTRDFFRYGSQGGL